MKKFLLKSWLISLCLVLGMATSWAETVPATMAAGTNGSTATVNGKNAIKVGTSNKGGNMTITVPANATSLTFYAAAWKGVSSLSINFTPEVVTTPSSVALTADEGISNNSPFTLTGDEEDYKFTVALSGIIAETTLTLAGSSAKRFVVWDATCEVGGENPSTSITIGETGYATFYDSEHAVELPAGVEAYVFMPMYGLMPLNTVNYEITENTVPAGEPVILMAAANDYTLEYVESDLLPVNDEMMYGPGTNLLQGTDVETTTTIGEYWGTMPNIDDTDVYTAADCYFYGLSLNASSDPESVGFYWMEEGGAAFTNGAHKAYLCIPAEVLPYVLDNGGIDPLEARGFAFSDMNTNGISNIAKESASEAIYTLSGVKVNSLQKGLNIVGGKKIMVK